MSPNYEKPLYKWQLFANNDEEDAEEDNPAIYNINFDDDSDDSDDDSSNSEDNSENNSGDNSENNTIQQDWSNFDYNEYINDIDNNNIVTSLKGHNGEL